MTDALQPLLSEADAAWDARGRDGLEPVDVALQRAFSLNPDHPGVAWRLARLRIAKGLMAESDADRVVAFGEARARSWECVFGDPRVRALRVEVGLQEALDELPESRRRCAAWAAHAWARWMAEFGGAAASLDLDELDVVIAYTRQDPVDPYLSDWTWALNRATRPEEAGRDTNAARSTFRDLLRRDTRRVEPMVDLYLYTARGTDAEVDVRTMLGGAQPDTPEERAYVERALRPL